MVIAPMKRVGIVYNPKTEKAVHLAEWLGKALSGERHDCWVSSVEQAEETRPRLAQTDVIVSVGGDGTILRVARLTVPAGIPILGVNMGRLGFMTEIFEAEALRKVPEYLHTPGWVEERTLLDVEISSSDGRKRHYPKSWVLNEVVISRGAIARLINVEARIDGVKLATFRADGVILATATGSTGYAMAAGGPVMDPVSRELLLVPICPHLTLDTPVVIEPNAKVQLELEIGPEAEARVTLDGQTDVDLRGHVVVTVRRSKKVARFLRSDRNYFYATLVERLNFRERR